MYLKKKRKRKCELAYTVLYTRRFNSVIQIMIIINLKLEKLVRNEYKIQTQMIPYFVG